MQKNKHRKKYRGNRVSFFGEALIHLIVGAFALVCVIPYIFIIIISFSSAESLRIIGYSFAPTELTLTSFQAVFELGDQLWRSFFNSILITAVGTVTSVLMIVMYSYGLFRQKYPFRNFFLFLVFFTMMFGGGLVPFVITVRNLLNLGDTYGAMILPMLMVPFHVLIMRTFFVTAVPNALLDAANIDGAGEFRTLFSIVVPLAKPGIATISLLTAIGYWNDWWHAFLFVRDRSLFPLQFLLMEMQRNIDFLKRNVALIGAQNINFANLPGEGLRMALCVIIVLPIACAYPFFQRYIISGLTIGAIKE